MKTFGKRFLPVLLILCLLAGCISTSGQTAAPSPSIEAGTSPAITPEPEDDAVEINGQRFDAHAASVTLALNDAQEVRNALAQFDALENVTLTSPALTPDEYRALAERFPDIVLDCDIRLGDCTASVCAEELDLSDLNGFGFADAIPLFRSLRVLKLGEASPGEVLMLQNAMPDLSIAYLFRGQPISAETTALDLRGAPVPDAAELEALFAFAPNLKTVQIDDPDAATQRELAAFNPRAKGVLLSCNVTVLDRIFPSDAETIDFADRKVTDEETQQIVDALPLFPNLKEIDLYESALGQETMDALFDGYPDIFFGWTFTMWNGFYTVRSDATAFSSMIGLPGSHNGLLTEDDFRNLRYCKGLQALDLGHNGIRNLDFLRNWPHMKILILADTRVTDLSVLAELQDLEYLELFLTTPDSYEPLTHLPHLLDLNLGHTKKAGKQYRDDDEIRMLTQITSLERLWINKTLTPDQVQILRDGLPGVEFDFSSYGSTDKGWREHPRFFIMRRCFDTRTYEPFE